MKKIAVIGAGAWGSALAIHSARLGHAVMIWALEPEVVAELNEQHRSSLYLPDLRFPESIRASHDPAEVLDGADLVIMVPPSKYLAQVSARIAGAIPEQAIVVVATKGIEETTCRLMSEVLAETLPAVGQERLCFLSGPSFAREVAKGLPTDVAVASVKAEAARVVQPILHSPMFRVYTSDDPVGVQVGGAVKNVVAVAAGACDGLELGTNARASLLTRGLAEITRLGLALGANPLTFLGLAGVGDLLLTCTGALSRNRTLGLKVAEGIDPQVYLTTVKSVAEGFWTSAATFDLARKLEVDMPITEQVFHVLHRRRPLLEALRLLLTRDFKDELVGIRDTTGGAPRSQ
jgi:glycerol-3-phosphate dehydrogenase (NAD(P)+)